MLTRLKVSGFKNLVDIDVRFGPFTCIAGANGVGKSNLLDAITFLSALADQPLIDAALSIRDTGARSGDVRNLFHRVGDQYADVMSFEVEMIVPPTAVDDLGQQARASITFLRYRLDLGYRHEAGPRPYGALELVREELSHIKIGDAPRNLLFHRTSAWKNSVISGKRHAPYFISTATEGGSRVVRVHQDGGSSGKPRPLPASSLPRTALSATSAAESPTAMIARREMQSWRLLQLEPSALREPDPFTAPASVGSNGAHLPATLYHLARLRGEEGKAQLYSQIANRLADLIEDVRELRVDRDEKRELLTLSITGRDGTTHPARALSDGTLRFLALATLEADPEAKGLLCLEEPENGIHPERVPAMLHLLRDMATDTDFTVDENNPLRQVIINTHSPAVVAQVPDDSLLWAELRDTARDGQRFRRLAFSSLAGTWRAQSPGADLISRGRLLSFLNPVPPMPEDTVTASPKRVHSRVIDRPDLQGDLDLAPGEKTA